MFFYKFISQKLINIIAPIECLICGFGDQWCCSNCQNKLTSPLPLIINNYSQNIAKVICAYNYQNILVQKLIHACKYDGIKEAIIVLANQLSLILVSQLDSQKSYLLLPVPLHPKRQRQRGFNQSQIIAEIIAHNLNLNIVNGQRIINTPHQVGLNGQQRQLNMKNVFAFNYELTNIKKQATIIIVDDVITTGATINSLAENLKKNRDQIMAVAIAKE